MNGSRSRRRCFGVPRARLAVAAGLLAAASAHAPLPAAAGEALYVTEGNRLRVLDLASLDAGPLRQRILIQNADTDPARGRASDRCALPGGSGRFVCGEDSGQPSLTGGMGRVRRRRRRWAS
jgi:hypothetical protein